MFLRDTNVISELYRLQPNSEVRSFVLDKNPEELFVSDVRLAEIRFGIEAVTNVARREIMQAWMLDDVRPFFGSRVLSADEDVWVLWKSLEHEAPPARHTFPQPDLVIAAIALRRGLTVVTRDTEPFRRANVPFVNPWKGATS